ncbi:MAG: S8 family serine peptidase, partial [Planctomycetota bacterium]
TVVDAGGVPVEGATVSGHWSGLTSDSDSGITLADGTVSLSSNKLKNPSGTFTFTVDNITKSGWTYDSGANVETSDSITVP